MSEQIKIEPLFGPQELFDGVPEYIEVIRFNDYSRDYLWSDLDKIKHLTFKDLKAIPIVAMRRIIKDPTRWTVANQKAGRFPEVGCNVDTFNGECVVIGCDSNLKHVAVQYHDDGHMDILYISKIKPIETPEERAKRVREEWCNEAGGVCSLGMTTLTRIYDALVSGDLPVPVKGE